MGLAIRLGVKVDTMTPHLRAALSRVKNKRPVLEAMGLALVSLTKRAFADASLRAARWPKKADGTEATLRLTGTLWRSIRITALTDRRVVVGTDRRYAAIHQLGGETKRKARTQVMAFGEGGRLMSRKAARRQKGGSVAVRFANIGAGKSGMPARPFFPFTPDGRATPKAREAVARAAKAKVESMLRGR